MLNTPPEESKPLIKTSAIPYSNFMPLFLVGSIFILSIGFYIYHFHSRDVGNPADFGSFGDFLGGVINPVVGLVTILLLLRQLNLQRIELNETRLELAKMQQTSDEALANSKKELDAQLLAYEEQKSSIQFDAKLKAIEQCMFKGRQIIKTNLNTFSVKVDSRQYITLDQVLATSGYYNLITGRQIRNTFEEQHLLERCFLMHDFYLSTLISIYDEYISVKTHPTLAILEIYDLRTLVLEYVMLRTLSGKESINVVESLEVLQRTVEKSQNLSVSHSSTIIGTLEDLVRLIYDSYPLELGTKYEKVKSNIHYT